MTDYVAQLAQLPMASDYVALLREAVRSSGLSATAYATTVLMRNPRSLRRWLAGESPIPEAVRDYLDRQATTI